MNTVFDAMGIDAGVMIILLLVLEIVLLIAVFSSSMKIRRLNAKYTSFMKGQNGVSLEKDINKKMTRIDKYANSIGSLDETIQAISDVQKKSIHKYGIVKYDAFDDVGGKLSFVLALLDDSDSGFVLNAVHSKDNCFLYIKEIVKGESYILLSSEEVEALRIARRYGVEEAVD
ncbi:MAG: DUF4446 family protein [Clostridiales bacterium]|jgi:hypothetical protein|uniref:DUF4446 family protein n=1 Tax=Chordicoccus furentiruminis TaxID=2709410 RepID=UPI0023A900A6|nr:DUF4446 family protein [Chordicoccus furentiruminis]MCI6173443.1 DUF4446 family protein [Clostridiales bacterium]